MKPAKDALPIDLHVMSEDELAQHLAIMMAADARRAPILRGSQSRRDQVDEHRNEFCAWVARRLLAHSMVAVMRRSVPGGSHGSMDSVSLPCPACGALADHQ